jgi:hypothetical protein
MNKQSLQAFLQKIDYRIIASRISLPLLALSASYGVYSYTYRFVPWEFAIITGAAFEMVYIGLALADLLPDQRKRARKISLCAVAVSVVYNWLAGFLDRSDKALALNPKFWDKADFFQIGSEVGMAFLHGAPLAIVGYFLADLLLHQENGKSIANDWQKKLNDLQATWQKAWDDLQDDLASWQIKAGDLQMKIENLQIKEVDLQNEITRLQASQQHLQIDVDGLTSLVTNVMKALTQRKLTAEEAKEQVRAIFQEMAK